MMLARSTGMLAGRTAWHRSGGKQVKKEPSSTLTPSIAGATLRCSARRRTAARHPRHPQRRPWLPVAARPHPCTRASRATERYIYASRRSGGRLAMRGKRLLQWQAVGASSRPANGPVPEGARTNRLVPFVATMACPCLPAPVTAPLASHGWHHSPHMKGTVASQGRRLARNATARPSAGASLPRQRPIPTSYRSVVPTAVRQLALHGQTQAKGPANNNAQVIDSTYLSIFFVLL